MLKRKFLFVVFSLLLAAIVPWARPAAVMAESMISSKSSSNTSSDVTFNITDVSAKETSTLKGADAESSSSLKNAPAAPNISGTHSYNSVTVKWSGVKGAARYRIYISTSLNGKWSYVTAGSSARSAKFTGLTPGRKYYFRVRAIDSRGYMSGYRATLIGTPLMGTPGYLKATAYTSSVSLSWGAVSGATSYVVQRSTSRYGSYSTIRITSSRSYSNTGLTSGKTYWYRVCAKNAYTSGSWIYVSAKTTLAKPNIPTSFRITGYNATKRSVTVRWNAASRATRYRVQISTSKYFTSNVKSFTTTGTSMTISGLTRFTYYYLRLRAENSVGNSSFTSNTPWIRLGYYANSETSEPNNLRGASDTESSLNAAVSGQTAKLTWKALPEAKSYEIYRSDSTLPGFKKVGTSKSASFKDSSLTYGNTYSYQVRAVLAANQYSDYTSIATAVIPAAEVTGLQASVSGHTAQLTWKEVSGIKSYEIYRSTSELSDFKKVGTSESTSFKDSGLSYGTTYYFKVRAVLGSKNYSDFSSIAKAEVPVVNVSDLKVSVNEGTATLNWSALSGAAGYEVYRSDAEASEFVKVGTVQETSFENSGLENGKTYSFTVRAVFSEGIYSDAGNVVEAVIPAAKETPKAENSAADVIEECNEDGTSCTITQKVCTETECSVTSMVCIIIGDQKACADPIATVIPVLTETPESPAATEAAPTEPAATEEAPAEPAATEEAPADPAATEAAATEAAATEAAPAEPAVTEAAPADPAATEAAPTDPAATEEAPAEPAATEEAPAEPAATEEAPAEPVATEDLTIREINIADLMDNTITFKAQESFVIAPDKLKIVPEAADWTTLSFKLDNESVAVFKTTDIAVIKAEGLTINGLTQGTTTLRIQAGNIEKAVTLVINMSAEAEAAAAAQAAAEAEAAAAAQAAAEAEAAAAAQAAAEAEAAAAAQAAAEAEAAAAAQPAAEAEAAAAE